MKLKAKIDVSNLSKNKKRIEKIVAKQSEESMNNIIIDLTRLSSEITPLDKGDLEQSWDMDVTKKGKEYVGSVRFEVWGEWRGHGGFNYAIWIHEDMDYNLGKKSKAKGGSTGLSGTFYPVDRKYLTRALYGEAETYRNIIEEEVKEKLKKG